jgi:hypothetical protein
MTDQEQAAYWEEYEAWVEAQRLRLLNPDLYPNIHNGTVVIDIGSSVVRVGWAGGTDQYPIRIPNVLARLPVCVLTYKK